MRAREIYAKTDLQVLAPETLWQLAMLFQHGSEPDDYRKARRLAGMSVKEGYEPALWLEAAAEDRYLLAVG